VIILHSFTLSIARFYRAKGGAKVTAIRSNMKSYTHFDKQKTILFYIGHKNKKAP